MKNINQLEIKIDNVNGECKFTIEQKHTNNNNNNRYKNKNKHCKIEIRDNGCPHPLYEILIPMASRDSKETGN